MRRRRLGENKRRLSRQSTDDYHRRRRRFDEEREQQRQASERGHVNDRRVVNALMEAEGRPEWITGVRQATPQEDMKNFTDAVVHTDIGDIRIQVKSSFDRAREFEAKHPKLSKKIIVFVVRDDDTRNDLRSRLIQKLTEFRKKRLPRS